MTEHEVRLLPHRSSLYPINEILQNDAQSRTFQLLSVILDTKRIGNWREPILKARILRKPRISYRNLKEPSLSPELTEAARSLMIRFDVLHEQRLSNLLKPFSVKFNDSDESLLHPIISENDDVSDDAHIDLFKDQYNLILDLLFRDQINWGRIISLFGLLRGLALIVEDNLQSSSYRSYQRNPTSSNYDSGYEDFADRSKLRAAHYVIWTTLFIHNSRVHNWIEKNGGWSGLVTFHEKSSSYTIEFLSRIFSEVIKFSSFVIGAAIIVTLGVKLCRYLKN